MNCKLCPGELFASEDEAKEHITSQHGERVNEELQEFTSEAEERVYQDLISE